MNKSKDLKYYMDLLNFDNYEDALKLLKRYNGIPKYSYHSKSPDAKKIKFYKHHIYEYICPNLGKCNKKDAQSPEKLVYCDLVEHFILHILILTLKTDDCIYKQSDKIGKKYKMKGYQMFPVEVMYLNCPKRKFFNKNNGVNTLLGKIISSYVYKNRPKYEEEHLDKYILGVNDTKKIINECFKKLINQSQANE